MEVKINKEIRDYTESVFFGLSPRQFFFSLAAVGVAVGLFFLLRRYFGTETVSWMCILGAAPFAALGFVRYHGMSAEQLLWAWIRSELLEPKKLTAVRTQDLYYDLTYDSIEKRIKTGSVSEGNSTKRDENSTEDETTSTRREIYSTGFVIYSTKGEKDSTAAEPAGGKEDNSRC